MKQSVIDYFVPSEYSFNPLEIVHVSETVTDKTVMRIRLPEFSGFCFNLADGIEYLSKANWKIFPGGHYTLVHCIGGWISIELRKGEVNLLMVKLPVDYMELFLDQYPSAISTYCAATKFLTWYSAFDEPQPTTREMQFALNMLAGFRSADNLLHVQVINALVIDLVLLHLSPVFRPYETKAFKEIDPAMETAKRLLHDYRKQWTPDMLADKLMMHKRTLNTKFKASFGMSPMEYLRHFKLKESVNLLNRGMSVADVAKQLGYKYHQDFDRAFKRKFKCSPSSISRLDPLTDQL